MAIRKYPYGFVFSNKISKEVKALVPEFKPVQSFPGFDMMISPDQVVDIADHQESRAIVLGLGTIALPSGNSNDQESLAQVIIKELCAGSWDALHSTFDYAIGRWVAFIMHKGELRIYNDATAIRPVYYDSEASVFCGHMPLLRTIRKTLELPLSNLQDLGQFRVWEQTQDPNIKHLSPNFYFSFKERSVHRFYPREELGTNGLTKEEGINLATEIARLSMAYWSTVPFKIFCALTAGLDTRVNAAAALGSGARPVFVTYGSNMPPSSKDGVTAKSYKLDFNTAQKITGDLALDHLPLLIENSKVYTLSESQKEILAANSFGRHALHFQGLYEQHLGQTPSICFVGTAFEGTRDYYGTPSTPVEKFSEFKRTLSAVAGFKKGVQSTELSDKVAQELWDRYDFNKVAASGYPISNLLYIELRCARFQTEAINCQETAFMPINPMAARAFFEIGQSYSFQQRRNGDYLYSFIRAVFPPLYGYQVNKYKVHCPVEDHLKHVKIGLFRGSTQVHKRLEQNRNDILGLQTDQLEAGDWKYFYSAFEAEFGSLNISLQSNYFKGRAVSNLEMLIEVNEAVVISTPLGLQTSPYHFHIEGLHHGDIVRAGIRSTRDNAEAWARYSMIRLLEWSESEKSASKSIKVFSDVQNTEAQRPISVVGRNLLGH